MLFLKSIFLMDSRKYICKQWFKDPPSSPHDIQVSTFGDRQKEIGEDDVIAISRNRTHHFNFLGVRQL